MYNVLLQQLFQGERVAGSPLNIGALSRELDVSQTPLREALARLEHTGLVQREALKGYRVADALSAREVGKLFDARLVLEPALTLEAGLRTTPEFLDTLREAVEELDASAAGADTGPEGFQHYWTSDDAFHRLIATQSDNAFLEQAFLSLGGHMHRFRLFTKRGHTGAAHAVEEHRAICDALERRQAERASELMRRHLSNAKARILDAKGAVRTA
ncbi:GntR family transcriptional regulator [Streptantibioticus cattleyicolor]|nr:GntR family transcriptional regulator [Streptantibioticus cattleyicolor]CCB72638.1 Transcriptional regulator [Streptantibioticus cattleyicolor NRRL 8057 = DSM 46488]